MTVSDQPSKPKTVRRKVVVVARIPLPAAMSAGFFALHDEMEAALLKHVPRARSFTRWRPWLWSIDDFPGANAFLEKQIARYPTDHSATFAAFLEPSPAACVEITKIVDCEAAP